MIRREQRLYDNHARAPPRGSAVESWTLERVAVCFQVFRVFAKPWSKGII